MHGRTDRFATPPQPSDRARRRTARPRVLPRPTRRVCRCALASEALLSVPPVPAEVVVACRAWRPRDRASPESLWALARWLAREFGASSRDRGQGTHGRFQVGCHMRGLPGLSCPLAVERK